MTPEEIAAAAAAKAVTDAKAAADAAAIQTAADAAAKTAADAEAAVKAKADADAAEAAAKANPAKAAEDAAAAEKAALLREVMDKKTKLQAANDALAAYKGVDPAKIAELLKKEADAEKSALEAKGDYERLRTMMAEEHTKENTAKDEEIKTLKASMIERDQLIDNLTLGNDFGNSTFIKNNLSMSPAKTRKLYGEHFEIEGGMTVAYDKPRGESNRTKLVNSSGIPFAFDEALKRIVEADPDYKTMAKANIKPGSGSKNSDDASKQQNAAKKDGLYGAARIVAGLDTL